MIYAIMGEANEIDKRLENHSLNNIHSKFENRCIKYRMLFI